MLTVTLVWKVDDTNVLLAAEIFLGRARVINQRKAQLGSNSMKGTSNKEGHPP